MEKLSGGKARAVQCHMFGVRAKVEAGNGKCMSFY